LNILNTLPFTFAHVPGRLNFPGHSLSLIVKGTFDLSPGGIAAVAAEQPFPTGDEQYPGDDEGKGSPRYESDFAWFKPRADLLLVGKCHTPGGTPARKCRVAFGIGALSRMLTVTGDRYAQQHDQRWSTTEAESFLELELRYENSFGGAGFQKNPTGKGYLQPGKDAGRQPLPLPNIEDPSDPTDLMGAGREPAGFGPLGRTWQTRIARMGTYSGRYRETRWPWFPEDFDWSYCNAAPEGMQLDGYLRGDEDLYCENMHPVHSQYRCRLPGLRIRCFLNRLTAAGTSDTRFEEVPMNLDTLWADMDSGILVLLWRGWAEVLSEDFEEVRDIFIMSESLDQPPAPPEQCHRLFLDRQAEEEKAWAPAPEEPAAAEDHPEQSPEPTPRLDPDQLAAQAKALFAQMGVDADSFPPEVKAKQALLFKKLAESEPEKLVEMQRRELDAEMKGALGKLGLDPDHLPPPSEKARMEQIRFMKELGVNEEAWNDVPELQSLWAIMAAVMPKAGMNPEDLSPLVQQVKKQQELLKKQFGVEEEEEAEKGVPRLTREMVQERAAAGESLAGENLRGLDLSGLEMNEIDFSRAVLAGAILAGTDLRSAILSEADLTDADLLGANLAGANLAGAELARARLEKACLKDADLAHSNMTAARLAGADLTDAFCEHARLTDAVLERIEAKDASFSGADLSGAVFRNAGMQGVDLSRCLLQKTDFQGADLTGASVEGATGPGVNFAKANLTELRASEGCDFAEGVFYKALGPDSIWEQANLKRSDFRYARMEGAVFTGACLEQADLSASNMKFCRFAKANLKEAKLVRMNLFEGSLEKADLTGANLSGSNMYGVEFLGTVMEKTETTGANLRMTKLQAR